MSWIARHIASLNAFADTILVGLAWGAAYFVRFSLLPGAQEGLGETFLIWFFPLLLLTLYFHLKNGFYDQEGLPSFTADVMRMLRSNTLTVVTFIVVLYFFAEVKISRLTIVFYALASTFLFVFSRVAFRSIFRKLRRRGYLVRRVFVVGDGPQVQKYLQMVDYVPGTGLRVVDHFGVPESLGLSRVQPLEALDLALATNKPDIVVLGFKDESHPFVGQFMRKYYDHLFQIQILASEDQALVGMTSENIGDLHVMSFNHPRLSKPELVIKRLLDISASAVGLFVLSPFFLFMAALVRASSPGPIFFGQERIGLDGERFLMWKFRTMKPAEPGKPEHGWTVANDPRRTKIGSFMRSTSIDELPQLWNVLSGEMSLVGPRPEQPFFVDKFRTEIPAYMLRHKMKAGITGWAQVNGWRGDTSLHQRIECDLYYIRNWTIWFDIKILLLTFVKGFVNKNAY